MTKAATGIVTARAAGGKGGISHDGGSEEAAA